MTQTADAGAWPAAGLEPNPLCPVCDAPERELLYQALADQLFRVAPGSWTIWRCGACRSTYLDPRPTEATIGLAYRDYYTHGDGGGAGPRRRMSRLRRALENDYANRRYGTHRTPFLPFGHLLLRSLPPLADEVDLEFRWLPPIAEGETKRVLDIGCGNGHWLALAREAGWDIAGADADPAAVARAGERGMEIRRGGAEAWLDRRGGFDVVTTNHSIEHLHAPRRALADMFALLKPGGRLFIETPNVESRGHRRYGRHWIGLDPPRHLFVLNRDSLAEALRAAGFVGIRQRRRPSAFALTAHYSARIAAGHDLLGPPVPGTRPNLALRLLARFARKRAEFIAFTALKPL